MAHLLKVISMNEEHQTEDEWIPREREIANCPCKSWKDYASCCMPYHYGRAKPETAEQLMRSRYSAYFFRLVNYLVESTHPETRTKNLRKDLEATIDAPNWSGLTILETVKGSAQDKVGKVEFIAEYYVDRERYELHERSRFRRYKGVWKYLDGKT